MLSDAEQAIDRILANLNEMVKAKHEETVRALTKEIEADANAAAKELKAELAKIEAESGKVVKES